VSTGKPHFEDISGLLFGWLKLPVSVLLLNRPSRRLIPQGGLASRRRVPGVREELASTLVKRQRMPEGLDSEVARCEWELTRDYTDGRDGIPDSDEFDANLMTGTNKRGK
jgi:hypothetical protein